MLLPDVNVLVYAHRAEDPNHAPYRRWLEKTVEGPAPFALSTLVAVGFVRVVTQLKFPTGPTPLALALAFVDTLAAAPTCRLVGPGESHWERVRELCRATSARGALVSDAQHAAVALENGCTLVSADRDFERFRKHGLRFERLDPARR